MKKVLLIVLAVTSFTMPGYAAPNDSAPDADVQAPLFRAVSDFKGGIEQLASDLAAAADAISLSGLSGSKTRQTLASLCQGYPTYVIDCSTIDKNGIMTTVEPAKFRKFEGSDVSSHPATIVMTEYRKPFMSRVFMTAEMVAAVAFEWPVFAKEKGKAGIYLGMVSVLVSPGKLAKNVVREIGNPVSHYEVWIMQEDGFFWYNPDPAIDGQNMFTNPYNKNMTSFLDLGREMTAQTEGSDTFTIRTAGREGTAEKRVSWKTLDAYGARLRIALVDRL